MQPIGSPGVLCRATMFQCVNFQTYCSERNSLKKRYRGSNDWRNTATAMRPCHWRSCISTEPKYRQIRLKPSTGVNRAPDLRTARQSTCSPSCILQEAGPHPMPHPPSEMNCGQPAEGWKKRCTRWASSTKKGSEHRWICSRRSAGMKRRPEKDIPPHSTGWG